MQASLDHDDLVQLVLSAQDGDPEGIQALVAACLPLVYNVVGRALDGHADVDDVVQETMLRVVDRLHQLRRPESFRSWLVSIAMQLVRDRHRTLAVRRQREEPAGSQALALADPGADFADLTIIELGLTEQRREAVEASRWLDPEDRQLLSLWWLELAGQLDRTDVATALNLSPAHTAVQIQRLKARLETSRLVVRALAARPGCPELEPLTKGWNGGPDPLWRKRFARHVRECQECSRTGRDLVAAERLLAVIGLVPPAATLGAFVLKFVRQRTTATQTASAGWGATQLVALAATVVVGATAGFLVIRPDSPTPGPTVTRAAPAPSLAAPAPARSGSTPGPGPARQPRPSDRATPIPAVPAVLAATANQPLREDARVVGRDYARSIGMDGHVYWLFNDTEVSDPWGFMANSLGRGTGKAVSGRITVSGDPRSFLTEDDGEARVETASRKLNFWVTGLVADPGRDRVLLSYDKVCRDSDANAPCGAVAGVAQGSGFAALDPQTGSVTRLDAGGTVTSLEGKDSRLTFGPDKAYPLDVVRGRSAYGYRCRSSNQGGPVTATVGRVPLSRVEYFRDWRYLKPDGSWGTDAGEAAATGPVCGSGHTVQWIPALQLYLNTYLPSLGGDVMYQVAADPAGPWSNPRRLARLPDAQPGQSRPYYALAAHPAYAEDGGLVQYLTYHDPVSGGQRLLRVVLASR